MARIARFRGQDGKEIDDRGDGAVALDHGDEVGQGGQLAVRRDAVAGKAVLVCSIALLSTASSRLSFVGK